MKVKLTALILVALGLVAWLGQRFDLPSASKNSTDIKLAESPVRIAPELANAEAKHFSDGSSQPRDKIKYNTDNSIKATYFGKDVDSRGYAPFVEVALTTGSGKDAMDAANIVRDCRQVHSNIDRVRENRATQVDKNIYNGYGKVIDYFEYQERLCQTLSPAILNSRPQLLLKAAREGVEGGAYLFISDSLEIFKKLSEADSVLVKQRLIEDAENGHESSVAMLATVGEDIGFTSQQTEDFKVAFSIFLKSEEIKDFSKEIIQRILQTIDASPQNQPNERSLKILRAMKARKQ